MCYIIVAVILKTNVGYEEEAAQSPQKKKIATDVYIYRHTSLYMQISSMGKLDMGGGGSKLSIFFLLPSNFSKIRIVVL